MTVFDIVTEGLCIIIPLSTIMRSQMTGPKKAEYFSIFGLRTSIISVIFWRAAKMAALVQPNVPPHVWARNSAQVTITMSLELSLGIILTSLPFIQPLVLGPNADKDEELTPDSDTTKVGSHTSSAGSRESVFASTTVINQRHTDLDELEHSQYHMTPALWPACPPTARWSATDRHKARTSTQFYASSPWIHRELVA